MKKFLNKFFGKFRKVYDANDYHVVFAQKALSYLVNKPKQCLVVGCKRGEDCRWLLKFGAIKVHGIDICNDMGIDFRHRKVKYFNVSAEDMHGIDSNTYDLVYCLATMEHIPNIDKAFAEMVRVTKPQGVIFSFSAPLWNSKEGHHKGNFFKDYPWIHLRLSESEIIELCEKNNIIDETGLLSMKKHVEYMLNDRYFNKLPAKSYIDVCKNLQHVNIIENKLSFYKEEELPSEIFAELEPKGYTKEELLAGNHTFVARKISKKRRGIIDHIPA